MATALTKEIAARRDEAALFAQENIASRDGLDAAPKFPWDIWRAMGRAGQDLRVTWPCRAGASWGSGNIWARRRGRLMSGGFWSAPVS